MSTITPNNSSSLPPPCLSQSSRKQNKNLSGFFANSKKKKNRIFIMESPQSVAATRTQEPVKSSESDNLMGVLEVFVHQARDIHNICIYHKQDVYAKLFLTNNPENSLSTKIINGGGRNPVFDDTLKFDVKNLDSWVKCEIYMMSRVKNYLEDQLLGFTLVPLSDVVVKNGKLDKKEFSLSSTDLYHSPAGFVELSLSYVGDSPEVMVIPAVPTADETGLMSRIEFDESEFLDPKIVCENNQMVSKYFDTDEFASDTDEENNNSGSDGEENKSTDVIKDTGLDKEDVVKPILTVRVEPEEQKVVQQDIVDMYTKSLQQFTESLAKMKLPLDIDSRTTQSGNSSSSQQTPKSASSRVFYGSRAFF